MLFAAITRATNHSHKFNAVVVAVETVVVVAASWVLSVF